MKNFPAANSVASKSLYFYLGHSSQAAGNYISPFHFQIIDATAAAKRRRGSTSSP
jgi:hypothetical protein